MEKTCPRCGKKMVVSPRELAMRKGVVVCPQCLAVFDMDGKLRTTQPEEQSQQSAFPTPNPTPATPSPATTPPEHFHYCPECGKSLPHGVKFCPYCGIRLATQAAPKPEATAQRSVTSTPKSQPSTKPQPSVEPQPSIEQEKPTPIPPTVAWTPVFPTVHYRMNKWGSGPASPRVRIVGYTIILLLLALLAFIIYQGSLISN